MGITSIDLIKIFLFLLILLFRKNITDFAGNILLNYLADSINTSTKEEGINILGKIKIKRISIFKKSLNSFLIIAAIGFLVLHLLSINRFSFYEPIKFIVDIINIIFSALLGALIGYILTDSIDKLENWLDKDIIDYLIINDLETRIAVYVDKRRPNKNIITNLKSSKGEYLIKKNVELIDGQEESKNKTEDKQNSNKKENDKEEWETLYYLIDFEQLFSGKEDYKKFSVFSRNLELVLCFTKVTYPLEDNKTGISPYVYINAVLLKKGEEKLDERIQRCINNIEKFCFARDIRYIDYYYKKRSDKHINENIADLKTLTATKKMGEKTINISFDKHEQCLGLKDFIIRKPVKATEEDIKRIVESLSDNLCGVIDIMKNTDVTTTKQNTRLFLYNRCSDCTNNKCSKECFQNAENKANSAPFQYFNVGYCYQFGKGVKKDLNKARECYVKAADAENYNAKNNLGLCYQFGIGGEKDLVKARECYVKAADAGNYNAKNNLGLCYQFGIGGEKDLVKARECYEIAAKNNVYNAMNNFGYCYQFGLGGEKDLNKAREWYEKAADNNNFYAKNNLGYCYQFGLGGVENVYKAFKLYEEAANKGCSYAKCNLGLCYQLGIGNAKNGAKAVRLFREAASLGNPHAMFNLGYCYQYGIGTSIDEAEAVRSYCEATKLGNLHASGKFDYCYQDGLCVTKDVHEVLEWYRKSAENQIKILE